VLPPAPPEAPGVVPPAPAPNGTGVVTVPATVPPDSPGVVPPPLRDGVVNPPEEDGPVTPGAAVDAPVGPSIGPW